MEQGYLFNPFTIASETTDVLKAEYGRIKSKVKEDTDIPFEIAANIEVYSNLNFIVGEMIARYKKEVEQLKQEIKVKESQQIYKSRDGWLNTHDGKAPAMSYFEAQAYEFVKNDYIEYNQALENLTRFKYAYDSNDNKIQALKKKYDAVKFEIGSNV